MRLVVITAAGVLVLLLVWRHRWLQRAAVADAARIRSPRYQPGMHTFDPALRDRTAQKRAEEDTAVAAARRRVRGGGSKLYRAS